MVPQASRKGEVVSSPASAVAARGAAPCTGPRLPGTPTGLLSHDFYTLPSIKGFEQTKEPHEMLAIIEVVRLWDLVSGENSQRNPSGLWVTTENQAVGEAGPCGQSFIQCVFERQFRRALRIRNCVANIQTADRNESCYDKGLNPSYYYSSI